MPSRVVLVLFACALFAGRAGAVTADECTRWIDQLGGEVTRADIRGKQSKDSRDAMMHEIDAARRTVDEPTDASLQRMKRVERQAAELITRGQVSRMEGQRLKNLSETTRRCLERVNAP
jgi:hypothetical protein